MCDDIWNVLVYKGLEHKDEDSKYADRVDTALDNSCHGRGSFPSKPTRLSDDLPQAGQQFTIGRAAKILNAGYLYTSILDESYLTLSAHYRTTAVVGWVSFIVRRFD